MVIAATGSSGWLNANQRFRNRYSRLSWLGISVAAVLHFLIFALWPDMKVADVSVRSQEIIQIDVVPEFEIPPPPENIVRPAIPVLSTDLNLTEDITIGEVTFEENPVSELPPPPVGRGVDVSDQPAFTPREVEPELRNRAQFGRELERRYPSILKDAGIGGTVVLWVHVTESGDVDDTRVVQSSGNEQLDKVAQDVMQTAKFRPAINRDQNVAVWIQLPVTFQVVRQ